MKKSTEVVRDMHRVTNLRELLEYAMEHYSNRPAFCVPCGDGVEEISYFDFYRDVEALAVYLHSLDLADKRIGLIGKNSYVWAMSYFAVLAGCGELILLDRQTEAEELVRLLAEDGADAILYAPDQVEKLSDLPAHIQRLPMDKIPAYIEAGTQLLKVGDHSFDLYEVDSNAKCLLSYTPDCAGEIRRTAVSQAAVCASLERVLRTLPLDSDDRVLSLFPLHRAYACLTGLLAVLCFGGSITFARTGADLAHCRPTVIVSSSAWIGKIRDRIAACCAAWGKGKDLLALRCRFVQAYPRMRKIVFWPVHKMFGGRLRAFVCGTASVSSEICCDLETFGFAVYSMNLEACGGADNESEVGV